MINEIDTFVEPALPTGAQGWAFWRDGAPNGFDTTKQGLLIGFDMMALRGLAACEQWMIGRGWACLPTRLVAAGSGTPLHGYGPTVAGVPDPAMIAWGVWWKDGPEESIRKSAAGYVAALTEAGQLNGRAEWLGRISAADRTILNGYWMASCDKDDPTLPKDKRRRVPHARRRTQALALLTGLDIAIVPLRWEVAR